MPNFEIARSTLAFQRVFHLMEFLVQRSNVNYSGFQVTFQSAFPKFVLNIPNYITKFGILRENVQSEICMLVN